MHDDAFRKRKGVTQCMMMRCRIGCLFVHHMNMMYDVLTLTLTCLMSREFLSKSLSTIRSACLDVEGAR